MSGRLLLQNRQRSRLVDLKLLRRISLSLLRDYLKRPEFDLVICLVSEAEMTRLNETHLRHAGSTDVITFDYAGAEDPEKLMGEIFVCVDEALVQARRFRTMWSSEVVRYVLHGILHLCGYDDQTPAKRKRMKEKESQVLRLLEKNFEVRRLEGQRGRAKRRLVRPPC